MGVYQGKMSRPEVRDFVDSCDCAIELGVLLSDVEQHFHRQTRP